MNQQQADRKWQELESRIHQMVGGFLKSDVLAIEHKPRHIALLQMPQAYSQKEDVNALS